MGWAQLEGITKSDKPEFAPENFREMEPVIDLKCMSDLHSSLQMTEFTI